MAALNDRRICASKTLADGAPGVRFHVRIEQQVLPAFAVRHHGRVCAYLNRCAHLGVELDWTPGHFFDLERRLLVCALHGAQYDPHSGVCAGGPCKGQALTSLPVLEQQGEVLLAPSAHIQLHT